MHEVPSHFGLAPASKLQGFMKQLARSTNQIRFTFLFNTYVRDGIRLLTPPRTYVSVRRFGPQYRSYTQPAWNAVCDLGDTGGDDEKAESGYLGAAID